MRHTLRSRTGALLFVALLLGLPATPTSAASLVSVPADTPVGLKFLTGVDSRKTTEGTKVRFQVIADVVQGHSTVIRSGTPVTGTVTQVTHPGAFGASAKVVIGFLVVNAVDGKPVKLDDVIVSKEMVSKSRAGAAGATVAGAIVLGPIGLLAGALIRGNDVEVPKGVVVTDKTRNRVSVRVM